LLMHPGALKRRELSCVGQVCFETESKVSPMYIDLVLPLKGEKMSLDELRDLISQRMLPNNPRFTSRVQGTTFIPTDVDLEHHVQELVVPEPGDDEALMKLMSTLTNEGLDPARPLWASFLVNQGDEKQYMVIRMHHCIGDGVSLATATMNMSDNLFNKNNAPESSTSGRNRQKRGTGGCCFKFFSFFKILLWILIGMPLVLLKWISVTLINIQPPELFKDTQEPSAGKHVAWNTKTIYVEDIKGIAAKVGKKATFNDVMLAVVAGAFDRYTVYAEKEVKETDMIISIPVDIRRTAPKSMGNKVGGYMIQLPMGVKDPFKRCRDIYKRTSAVKKLPEQYASYWLFLMLSYLPVFIVRPVFKQMSNQVNCVVTNVRGAPSSYSYLGREVSRLIGFIPPPNPVPIGIAISSLDGEVNVTIKAERSLIQSPAKFIQFVHEEIEAMRQDTITKKEQ